jgi:hypothetical protein
MNSVQVFVPETLERVMNYALIRTQMQAGQRLRDCRFRPKSVT